ncbi:hydroxyacylglutathione hydrolase [Halomonas halocynthiae]|uniref:hydroxyacylglutathione hydrolase n=1 Tax=Halomonas halocynthiae TaxID=176290 RepID=UPI0003F50CA2|nr:hydroxyacylglutathione hydrolase [Halomonas halocynthiae]
MLSVTPIPAFHDNYIWMLRQDSQREVCVVDPGDAAPVIAALDAENLTLASVLITHHHADHTGGLPELVERYAPHVIGPHNSEIANIDQHVGDGDDIRMLGRLFEVIEVPGHTLDHIAFFTRGIPAMLFCGDTLFSAGCGRLFEGSPEQMHSALSRFTALPDDTLVFAAHEYTLSNLEFASAADPKNKDVQHALAECRRMRKLNRPTLPSSMERERRINPFLRCHLADVQQTASAQGDTSSELATFATLRTWKDSF